MGGTIAAEVSDGGEAGTGNLPPTRTDIGAPSTIDGVEHYEPDASGESENPEGRLATWWNRFCGSEGGPKVDFGDSLEVAKAFKDAPSLLESLGKVLKEFGLELPGVASAGVSGVALGGVGTTQGALFGLCLASGLLACKLKIKQRSRSDQFAQSNQHRQILNNLVALRNEVLESRIRDSAKLRALVTKLDIWVDKNEGHEEVDSVVDSGWMKRVGTALERIELGVRTISEKVDLILKNQAEMQAKSMDICQLRDYQAFGRVIDELIAERDELSGKLADAQRELALDTADMMKRRALNLVADGKVQEADQIFKSFDATDLASRKLDHLEILLVAGWWERAAEVVSDLRRYASSPQLQASADLLWRAATTCLGAGLFQSGIKLAEAAYDMNRDIRGPEDLQTISSMSTLGSLYEEAGRFEESEPILRRVLSLRMSVLGQLHPATISSINNMSQVLFNRGDRKGAEDKLLEARFLSKLVLGPKHLDTIGTTYNLGAHYVHTGEFEKAEPLLVEVLALRREILGPTHRDTLSCLNLLGILFREMRRLEEAEPLLIEACERREYVLGPRHPHTIDSMYNLAGLLVMCGKREEGVERLSEVLALRREVIGAKHPSTIRTMVDLASVHPDESVAKELACEAYGLSRDLPPKNATRSAVEAVIEELQVDCSDQG